jgi:hypothetical protein
MNPIPTLRLCARLGYAALALLSPDLALLLSPALELLPKLAPASPGAVQA